MSEDKQVTAELSGFTIAPDILIQEYDFITALVWGKIWRYWQMEDEVCRAAIQRLANELGMSTKTIERRIKDLERDGYIVDKTPTRRNAPHNYADTGKLRFKIGIGIVRQGKTVSPTGKTHSPQRSDSESYEDSIKELKEKEEETPNAFKLYEQNIGALTPILSEKLGEDIDTFSAEWVLQAIGIAALRNARNYKFIRTVLDNALAKGKSPDLVTAEFEEKKNAATEKKNSGAAQATAATTSRKFNSLGAREL